MTPAELTAIGLLTAVRLLVVVSVAVSVWLPEVLNVTWKVPVPLVNTLLVGMRVAAVSLAVRATVPL